MSGAKLALTKDNLITFFFLTAGALLTAMSISLFFAPANLVTGGVSGLAIIISDVTKNTAFPVPIWLTTVAANVPLFLIGFKVLGFKSLAKTIYATVALTLFLYVTELLPPFRTGDLLLVALYGGLLQALGLGLIFRCVATTGGTDTAAAIIHKALLPYVSVARIMFFIDSAVILTGIFQFGLEKGLYAVICVFVVSKGVDSMLEGLSFGKAIFIISDKSDEIAAAIMADIDRGVTSLFGKGMYTNRQKNVLLCVVSKKQIVEVKAVAKAIDPDVFAMVADVREVLGVGFNERMEMS